MHRYYLYRLAGLLCPYVPRRLAYAILGVAARIWHALSASNRNMVHANLRHVLGTAASDAELNRLSQRIFHNLLKNYFDLFWLPAQSTDKVRHLITVRQPERVQQAFAMNKGVIAVSVHLGNQEVMTHAELITDRQVTVVVEHIKPEKLYQYILSMRRRGGMRLIAEDGALRELFRALRRGEAIALAADRDVTESGRVIPFFGAPAKLPDGYALLALKFGCPVLPSFIIRAPGDRFEIHIAEPMLFQGRADQPSDVQAVMASVVGVTEKYIERYIDQWVYFHYVWEDGKNDKDGIERTQREQTGAA